MRRAANRTSIRRGAPRKKGRRLPGMAQWASDSTKPWTELNFNQFGLHASLAVKTQQGSLLQGRRRPRVDHRPGARSGGQTPGPNVLLHQARLEPRQILTAYAYRWAIECTFENCKQFLGLEDPANRLPKAVARTAPDGADAL